MARDEQTTIAALLRTSCALAAELDFDRLVQTLTDEATALCRAQFGVFFYNVPVAESGAYMLYTVSGVDRSAFDKFPMPRKTAIFAPTFEGLRVVRFDDVTQAPEYGKNEPHYGMPAGHLPVRSYMAVPVTGRSGEVIGGLFFGHSEPAIFQADDEDLLMAVAAQAAVAIEHARLYRDVKAAHLLERRRAALAEDMSMALNSGEPRATRLQRCATALIDHSSATLVRIWEHDGEGSLHLAASAGIDTRLDGGYAEIQSGQYEIGQIAAQSSPYVTNDVLADPRIHDKEWAEREGIVSFAGDPLLVDGRLVGVLAMWAREPLDESTLKLLRGVAGQIAMAIERDRAGEARERFRRLFLSMLGHDLRNPLGAIAISAQMLERLPDMPAQSQAGLQRIRRGTERMTRMVQQLLDFARVRSLESSGIPIERRPGDLTNICREVVEELRTSQPTRRIEESYEGDCTGQWDTDRMAQVFSNLIENALNHGDPATPVSVRLWRRNGLVCGEVYNRGEPIPQVVLDGLFDPFRRVQAARTARTRGLGLGLFITHQIVLAHGGTLFVLSSEENGTTFRLSLPA
jgi:signal transduction histidine kinase